MSEQEAEVVEMVPTRAPQMAMELSVEEVVRQVEKIQQVMKAVFKKDQHYGVIPGTGDKPTLLKPGAEKLCLLFRLAPTYDIVSRYDENDRVACTVKCTLTHIPTGLVAAAAIGSCDTRETKYRYRLVPTDLKPSKQEAAKLKAAGAGGWRKRGAEWVWCERVENDNAREHANTILKMAEKRALVAAVLNATAASDFFTQDVEDLPGHGDDEGSVPAGNDDEGVAPQPAAANLDTDDIRLVKAALRDLSWSDDAGKAWLKREMGHDRFGAVPKQKARELLDKLEAEIKKKKEAEANTGSK